MLSCLISLNSSRWTFGRGSNHPPPHNASVVSKQDTVCIGKYEQVHRETVPLLCFRSGKPHKRIDFVSPQKAHPILTADMRFCSENITFENWALESFQWEIGDEREYTNRTVCFILTPKKENEWNTVSRGEYIS